MRIFPKSVCKRRAVYRGRKSARKSHLSNQIRHWQTQFQLLQHDDDLLDLKLLSLHGQSPHLSWEESAGTPPQNLTTSVVSAPPRWRTVTALRICFYWPRTLRRRLCPDHKGVTDKETQWSFKIHENSDRDEESDNRIDNGT